MIIDTLLYKSYLSSGSSPAANVLIFGAIGVILTVVGAILYDRSKKLIKTGIKVEGIVFSIEHEVSTNDSMGLYYPVIRYLTLQDEWITKRYNIGSRPSSYSEGDAVTVIYDSDNTSVFMLNDGVSKVAPLAGIISWFDNDYCFSCNVYIVIKNHIKINEIKKTIKSAVNFLIFHL